MKTWECKVCNMKNMTTDEAKTHRQSHNHVVSKETYEDNKLADWSKIIMEKD